MADIMANIEFKPLPQERSTEVKFQYSTLFIEDGNGVSCFIPGFDLRFFAPTVDESKLIGKALTRSYLDYWMNEQGQNAFLLELSRMGFKTAKHDFVIQNLLKNKPQPKVNFKKLRSSIPSEFENAQKFNEEANFAMAV